MGSTTRLSTDSRIHTLSDLVASYAILPTLASWLTTTDLYNLARTNRTHYLHILDNKVLFANLRRFSLCDGRGLLQRQNFGHPYSSIHVRGSPLNFSTIHLYGDEEIEVRLYNAKCDQAGALPCRKCGINVCEECRFYPRARPARPNRRPHINSAGEINNIMCLCPECDEKVEKEVAGQFLSELCDCEPYNRWICTRCVVQERRFALEYFQKHTLKEFQWDEEEEEVGDDEDMVAPSKTILDHGFHVAFWCVCGKTLKQDNPVRCTWCKRRHLPEEQWREDGRDGLPFFDLDPDYLSFVLDNNGNYPTPYPRLGYDRPEQDLLSI